MNTNRRAYLATGLMLLGVAGAQALTPKLRRSDVLGPLDLETAIPKAFGDWQMDSTAPRMIVDPQTQATINAAYTATLSRVYVNTQGQRIMLSLAYGAELSDTGIGLHYPEVCYPAQGFKVNSSRPDLIALPQGTIKARRLETQMAQSRFEPVTYWTMIGDHSEYAGLDRKLAELRSGLMGVRPDGLLFRVSSITKESKKAFRYHDKFIETILTALPTGTRSRMAGI